MNLQTYQYLHKDALSSLDSRQLLSALQSLQGMAASLKQYAIKEEVETLFSSYQMMLNYMTKGAKDPQRSSMYRGFYRRAYELADILERVGELSNDSSFYTTSLRTLQNLYGEHYG